MKKIFQGWWIHGNKKVQTGRFLIIWALTMPFFNSGIQAQNCTVNSGVDDSICPNQLLQLHGASAGIFTGLGNIHWTQRSGPSVNIVDPYDMNTYVTGYVSGGYYSFYLWGKCGDGSLVRDSVNVHIFSMTTAQAGSDQAQCPGDGVLTMSANAPGTGETGGWSIVGANHGVSFVNAASPTTQINLSPGDCGVTVLRWTIIGEHSCSSYDDVLITNYGGITPVNAGVDQILGGCYSTITSTNLSASNGGCGINGQSGHWTVVSGPNIPTLSNANSNTSGLSNLIEGTYILRWDVVGPCSSGTDLVTIVVPHALGGVTGASAGGGQIFCDGRTTFTLTGNNPLNANEVVTWTGGAPDAIINSPNTPITTVTVPASSVGTYSFTYTIQNTITNCSSSAGTSVTFAVPPTITLNADIVLPCGDSIATITYTRTGGGTLQWSIVNGPTNWYYPVIPTPYTDATTSPQYIYHLSAVGTYTIRFRISPGTGAACNTVTADVNVTTSQLAQSSNSGTPQILACNIFQTHLAGNHAFKGTGLWTEVSHPAGHPASIYHPTDDTSFIYNLYPGVYRFRWTISYGTACPPNFDDTRVIVVAATPSQADAGPDQTVCYGSPIIMQGNSPLLNEWGEWTVDPPGPAFSDPTAPDAIVNNLALNTLYTFTWTIYNACGSTTDDVNIQTNFDPGPLQADAGPDQCIYPATVTTATLAGNDPGPGTGTWRQVPAPTPPVTITNPTLSNTTITGLAPGTYQFEWAIMYNGCGPTLDTVIITITNPVTPSSAGGDRDICGDTIHLAGNLPAGGEFGVWTQTSGNAGPVIEDPDSPTSAVTMFIPGFYQFNWTISNGACSANADSVIFRVSVPPSLANAGPDRTLCGQDTVNLAAITPTAGTGSWNVVSSPNSPVFSDFADPHAQVSGLITGTYTFRWTITGGPYCPNSTDDVTITVYAAANAGADHSYCDATTVELTGNAGSVGVWTNISGPNVPVITPTAPASNKSTASPLVTGTYVFEYNVSYTGCSSSDQVSITISGQPTTASAGPEQFLCKLTTPYYITLHGNKPEPGHGTGMWSRLWPVSDPGASFSDPTDSLATYGPATAGLYIFQWTITDGTCSSSAQVRVNLYDPPTPSNAGSNQEICGTLTTMDANLPAAGLGSWTQVSGPNTALFTSVIIPDTDVSGLIEGSYLFRWTIKNGTVCDSSTSTVTVKVHTNPGAPLAGPDQNFCETAPPISTTLAGNTISPGTGLWSQALTDPVQGVTFDNAASPVVVATFPGYGIYHLIWTATNPYTLPDIGNCILNDEVVITIDQNPSDPDAGTDFSRCRFANVSMNATAAAIGSGIWTVDPLSTGPGPVTFVDPDSPTTMILGTGVGIYLFNWTITNGLCPPKTDQVQVTILDFPPTAIAGPNQNICNLSYTFMAGNSPGSLPNFGTWSQVAGAPGGPATLTFVNPNSPTTEVTGFTLEGTYKVIWTISNGGCTTADTIQITKYPDVTLTCPSDAMICNGGTQTLTVIASGGAGPGTYIYQWESNTSDNWPGTIIPGATNASYTTPVLTSDMYYRVTVQCGFVTCVVHVNVVPDPVITSVSPNPTICSGTTAILSVSANGGTPDLLYQWYTGTSCAGTTNEITGATNGTYTTLPLAQTTFYRVKVWAAGNGCGTVYSDCISVFVPNITLQPTGTVLCSGGTHSMTVAASSSGGTETFAYQWQISLSNSPYAWSNVTDGTGGNTASYSTAVLTTGNYYYQCIITITSLPGCADLVTNPGYVQVFNDPVVTGISELQQICRGTTGSLFVTVTGGTGSLSYQWQIGTKSIAPPATNCGEVDTWTNVTSGTGANSPNYTTAVQSNSGVYFYRCYITQTGVGCGPVESACISLTVDSIPDVTASLQTQSICSLTSSTTMLLTSVVSGTTFAWTRNSPAGITTSQPTSGSGDIIGAAFTNSTNAPITITYTITPTGPTPTFCVGTPVNATVIVNPIPTVSSAATKTICNNTSVAYTPTSAVTGTTYTWTASVLTEPTGGTITGFSDCLSGCPAGISHTLVNSGSSTGVVRYVITPTGPGSTFCVGPAFNFDVTVQPTPDVIAAPPAETFCSGGTTAIDLSTNVPGTTFYYAAPTISGAPGNITGGVARPTPGNTTAITNTLINTTAAIQTATYTVYPVINGCTGTAITVVITVNPVPIVTNGLVQGLCTDASFQATSNRSLTTTPSMTGATFTYPAPVNTGGMTGGTARVTGSTDPITDLFTNTTSTAQTATYSVTATAPALLGGCVGIAKNVVITVYPRSLITSSLTGTVCSGYPYSYNITSNVTGSTFAWTRAIVAGISNGAGSGSTATINETLINTTGSAIDVSYVLTPTGPAPLFCLGTASTLVVTVNPTPSVTTGLVEAVCSQTAANLTLTTTPDVDGTTYYWPAPTISGAPGNITGGTARLTPGTSDPITDVLTNTTTSPQTATYVVTPRSPLGCVGSTRNVVITVNPIPTVSSAATKTICNNTSVAYTPTSAVTGTTYTWTASVLTEPAGGTITGFSDCLSGCPAGISHTLVNSGSSTGVVRYVITPTGPGSTFCVGPAFNFDVTVQPTPDVIAAPPAETFCSGGTTAIDLSTNVPGTTFYYAAPEITPGGSGSVTGWSSRTSPGNTNGIIDNLINTTAAIQTVIYTIYPIINGCTGTAITVVITVNPVPVLSNLSQALCTNGTFDATANLALTTTPAMSNVIYTWPAPSLTGGMTYTNNGTGLSILDSYHNGTLLPQTATYTITPTAPAVLGGCIGLPHTVVITVYPRSLITSSLAGAACSGSPYNYTITGNVTGSAFTWSRGIVAGITPLTGGGSSANISETLVNSTGDPITVTYVLTPTGPTGCAGTVSDLLVNVVPSPAVNAGTNATICQGSAFFLGFAAATNYTALLWSTSGDGYFNNNQSVNPIYTPGAADILLGYADLTLTATGIAPCPVAASTMRLTILPAAVVNAGTDGNVCSTAGSYTVSGATASNYSALQWTHNGTGSLANATGLTPTYTFGTNETGSVTLTITATGNPPCGNTLDQMVLTIVPGPVVSSGPDGETCQSASYTVTGAIAYNYTSILWTHDGFGTLSNAGTLTPTYTPLPAESGTVNLTMTVTGNSPCQTNSDVLSLTITPRPVVDAGAGAPSGGVTCENMPFNITDAFVDNAASVIWTAPGPGTLTNATTLSPTYTPAPGQNGLVILTLTAEGLGSCSDVSDQVTLEFKQSADIVTNPLGAVICRGSVHTMYVNASGGTGTLAYQWQESTTGSQGAFTDIPDANNSIYTTLVMANPGSTWFRCVITQNGSPCDPLVSSAAECLVEPCCPVTFNEQAVDVCKNSENFPVDVLANGDYSPEGLLLHIDQVPVENPSHGSITWLNGSTFVYTPVQGYTGPDRAIIAVCDNGTPVSCCTNDTIFYNVIQAVTAVAGDNQLMCNQYMTFLTGNWPPAGSTGTWKFVSGPGIVNPSPANSPVATVAGLVASNIPYVFRYVVSTTNGTITCKDSAQMTVTNYHYPSSPFAGYDQKLCLTAPDVSTILTGNLPLFGSGIWQQVSGPNNAVIVSASSETTLVTNLVAGNYTFSWGIFNGVCDTVRDLVDVSVYVPSDVESGGNATICEGSTYTLGGSSAVNCGTMHWGTMGSGYFNDPTLLHPVYTPGPSDIALGSVVLYIKCASCCGIPCPGDSSAMILTITKTPTADAGADAAICAGSMYYISGTTASNYNVLYWTTSGTGFFTNSADLNPGYTPGVEDTISGTVVLTLHVTGFGTCNDASNSMTLSIYHQPTGTAGPNDTICEGSVCYLGSSFANNYSTYHWTTSGSGYFSNPEDLHPVYMPGPSDVWNGSVVLTLNITGITPCGNLTRSMVLSITRSPWAFANNYNNDICQGSSYTVSNAQAGNYSSILWTASGPGVLTGETTLTPTYTPTPEQTGVVTLILTAYPNSGCSFPATANLSFNIRPLPEAYAGPDDTICEGVSYELSGATASNFQVPIWNTSGTGYFNNTVALNPVYTPSPADIEAGSVTLTLNLMADYPCPNVTDEMILTIRRQPIANAEEDVSVCMSSGIYMVTSASASNYASLLWTTSGTGALTGETTLTPEYTFGTGETGTVTLTLTASPATGSPCVDATDAMEITIIPSATAGAGIDATICGSAGSYTLAGATATNFSSLLWTTDGTGTFSNIHDLNPVYTPSAADITIGHAILTLTAFGDEPCGNAADGMVLMIEPAPVANAGQDAAICESSTSFVCNAMVSNYTGFYWETTGTGTFNNNLTLNPIYIPSQADVDSGCVFLVLHVAGNPPCDAITDTMKLCISRIPLANAGPDDMICLGFTYQLTGSMAQYYGDLTWTTSGSGTFDDNKILHPVYMPGPADIAAGSVILTMNLTANSPCQNISDGMVLQIHPNPVATAFVVANVRCDGFSDGSLSVTVTGGSPDYTYLWSDGQLTQTATGLAAGTYMVTVTDQYGCIGTSGATVGTDPLPVLVITNPDAVCEPNTVNLTDPAITAGSTLYGAILSYWMDAGATIPMSNPASAGSGLYFIMAATAPGCSDIEPVVIIVNPLPDAFAGNDRTICYNTSTTLGTTAVPGNTYSWISVPAGFTSTEANPVVSPLVTTTYVLVETTTATGCANMQSVLVTVDPVSEGGTVTSDQTICLGTSPADLVLTGNTGSVVYWQKSSDAAFTSPVNIPETSSVLPGGTIGNLTENTYFRAIVQSGVCDPVSSSFVFISVNLNGQVNQPESQVLCTGTTTSITFETVNAGGITTYSWTNSAPEIGLGASGTGNISFTATNTSNLSVDATIVVTPVFTNNGVSCTGPPETFTITVNPAGQVNDVDDQVVCNGAITTPVTFTTVNTDGITTYSWTNDQPGIGLATGGTGEITAFTAINTGTVPVVATITVTPVYQKEAVSCTGPSKTFTITVNPTAQVNDPSDQIVCNGALTNEVEFETNVPGIITYSWVNNTTSIGLGAGGSGNIPAFTAINNGTEPVVATIVVTPTYTNAFVSCTGNSENFTITVNPSGQVNDPSDQVICTNTLTNEVIFNTNNSGGTTTYTWVNDTPGIGLAAIGLGNISPFTAINNGNAPVVATVTVTPYFTNGPSTCSGTSQTFTITVNPMGQVNDPPDQVLCDGSITSAINFITGNTIGTTTFTWTNNQTSIGLAASGSGNIPAFTATNSGTQPVIATITVTPHFTYGTVTCDGLTQTLLITVNPRPVVVTHPQAVCSPNKVDLTASAVTAGSTPGLVYTYWTNAAATIPYPTPATASSGIYYIKGAFPVTGCYSITPVTVTINPLPTIFSGTGSGSYCAGGPGLIVGLSGSQVGVNYNLWYGINTPVGSTVLGTGGPISFGIQTLAGNYSVIAVNATTHCVNWMLNCISISIIPQLPVSLSITPSENPVQEGTLVTFTATPVNGGTSPSYQWKVNGVDAGANNPTYSYMPVNADEILCIITSNATCVSGNPAVSNVVTMDVQGLPPVLTITGTVPGGTVRCYNATQTLTVAGNGTELIIQSGGSGTMIAGQNIRYLPGTNVQMGGYMHGYISTNNQYCGQRDPSIPTVVTGEDQLPLKSVNRSFKIYPNPTSGDFTVEQYGDQSYRIVRVEIFGMTGDRLLTGGMAGEKKHEFRTSDLPAGLYFVKVVAGDYVETFKLVKTR